MASESTRISCNKTNEHGLADGKTTQIIVASLQISARNCGSTTAKTQLSSKTHRRCRSTGNKPNRCSLLMACYTVEGCLSCHQRSLHQINFQITSIRIPLPGHYQVNKHVFWLNNISNICPGNLDMCPNLKDINRWTKKCLAPSGHEKQVAFM